MPRIPDEVTMSGQQPPQPGIRYAPRPYDPVADLLGNVKSILWSAGFVTFMAILVLNMAIVTAMTPEIQGWITGSTVPKEYIFIITPWPVLLFWIDGLAFQAWHLLMLSILLAAFAKGMHGLWKSWSSGKDRPVLSIAVPAKAVSSIENVAKLFMACMFFSTAYFITIGMLGAHMDTPAFDEMSRPELIYGLFSASVFEELISRVLLVGAPLALAALAAGRRGASGRLLGGGMDLTRTTALLIAFSALIFALAHVGSWDLWKVPQVLVTGLALGWAFVRYGLHASILIHFSINLSTSAMEIWPGNVGLDMLLGVFILIWLAAGAYFFIHYAMALARRAGMPVPARKAHPARRPARVLRRARRELSRSMSSARSVLGIRRRYARRRKAADLPPPPPGWQAQHGTVPPPPWAGAGSPPQKGAQPPAWHQPARPAGPHRYPPPEGAFVCPQCGGTDAAYEPGRLRCLRCGAVQSGVGQAPEAHDDGKVEF